MVVIMLLIGLIALSYSLQPTEAAQSSENQQGSEPIYLCVGSPLILHHNKIVFLDPTHFDITAMVKNKRTLLPLRAISEYFGAEISYDAI